MKRRSFIKGILGIAAGLAATKVVAKSDKINPLVIDETGEIDIPLSGARRNVKWVTQKCDITARVLARQMVETKERIILNILNNS
jgi:hypothetical protein